MSNDLALNNDDIMMRKMQSFRLDIIEDIMAPSASNPNERIIDKDPKMVRVALVAMDGVDNSIQKRQRLALDKQAQENEGDFQRSVVGMLNQVMTQGGMALNTDTGTTAETAVPVPQINLLPAITVDATEAHIGVEHIEYDDIMKKDRS